jgi:hypothetical protein
MSGLPQQKLSNPGGIFGKEGGSMTTETLPEAKRAWLISQLIEELNNLLWKRYEDEFISFVLEEKDPDYQSILADLK